MSFAEKSLSTLEKTKKTKRKLKKDPYSFDVDEDILGEEMYSDSILPSAGSIQQKGVTRKEKTSGVYVRSSTVSIYSIHS